MLHASTCIIQKEGILGLYKGLLPAMMGVGPQMGLQFGLYTGLQMIWDNVLGLHHNFMPGIVFMSPTIEGDIFVLVRILSASA